MAATCDFFPHRRKPLLPPVDRPVGRPTMLAEKQPAVLPEDAPHFQKSRRWIQHGTEGEGHNHRVKTPVLVRYILGKRIQKPHPDPQLCDALSGQAPHGFRRLKPHYLGHP